MQNDNSVGTGEAEAQSRGARLLRNPAVPPALLRHSSSLQAQVQLPYQARLSGSNFSNLWPHRENNYYDNLQFRIFRSSVSFDAGFGQYRGHWQWICSLVGNSKAPRNYSSFGYRKEELGRLLSK